MREGILSGNSSIPDAAACETEGNVVVMATETANTVTHNKPFSFLD